MTSVIQRHKDAAGAVANLGSVTLLLFPQRRLHHPRRLQGHAGKGCGGSPFSFREMMIFQGCRCGAFGLDSPFAEPDDTCTPFILRWFQFA